MVEIKSTRFPVKMKKKTKQKNRSKNLFLRFMKYFLQPLFLIHETLSESHENDFFAVTLKKIKKIIKLPGRLMTIY